jgi:PAS domain S-box-containing protein
MLKRMMPPPRSDIRAGVAQLTEELLNPPAAVDLTSAIEHLRSRIHAVNVRLWLHDGQRISCTLDAGSDAARPVPIGFAETAAIIQRLRHAGTVVCRLGDVSGLELLVPPGVRSFVAAAAPRRDTVGAVLVAGWASAGPPIDHDAAADLRIAAAVLASALQGSAPSDTQHALSDTILDSLPERIAVIDRDGIVSAVNATWREFRLQHGASMPCMALPGMSYAPECAKTATAGATDGGALFEGIRAACTRGQRFTTAITCGSRADEHWCLLSATPLTRREGGAVVTLTDLSRGVVVDMARAMTSRQFRQLADTVPVPIWILSPDGRLWYGNERWAEACGHTDGQSEWTDAFHPEDRERAVAEFKDSVAHGSRFDSELRLRTTEGTYRWSVCSAAPRYVEGHVDSYVGVCWDASAKRRAESTLAHVAGKLVVAQEQERSRIARELHDDVGQQVAVLTARLSSLTKQGSRSEGQIQEAYRTAQEIASTIHSLSHQLHPAKLRLLGLVRTLEALCRDEAEGTKVKVTFTSRDVPRHLHESTALPLFRVAQEALHNALKHSGATTVEVELAATPAELQLRVTDNGTGLDPLAAPSAGLGLLTMRERVELAGGILAVEQARPRGTTIRARVPLAGDSTGAAASPTAGAPHPRADVPATSKR